MPLMSKTAETVAKGVVLPQLWSFIATCTSALLHCLSAPLLQQLLDCSLELGHSRLRAHLYLSLLSASTWFHLALQKNLELFLGCVGKRNKSSAAESHAERGRHMTKASSKVVPIKGKCCKLMGRQEMPTQFAPVYCHFIQKIVPTPRVWMLTHLLWVRCWLLGWVLGKQQWGCEEQVGGLWGRCRRTSIKPKTAVQGEGRWTCVDVLPF